MILVLDCWKCIFQGSITHFGEAILTMTLDDTKEENPSSNFAALELLFRWKKFIIINVLVVSIVAAVISLLLPNYYKATASVLPPKQQDLFSTLSGISSLAKSIPGAGRLGLGQRPTAYNYFAILNSRASLERIIRQFDLMTVYDISDSSMEKTIKVLSNNVAFEEQTDENITFEVKDKDPRRASAIANAFIDVLNDLSIKLGSSEARNNRQFLEDRLSQARVDLRSAENALKEYQEKSRMIITSDQSAGLSGMAALYALRAKKEIELAVMQHGVVMDNPLIEGLRVEISELDKKLGSLPGIGVESLRRYREVLVQQQIQEFLVPLYEQAKINEFKDLPVVLVLDKAVPPEKRSSPQRSIIVLVSFVLALFISIMLVYLLLWLSNSKPDGPLGMRLRDLAIAVAKSYRIPMS